MKETNIEKQNERQKINERNQEQEINKQSEENMLTPKTDIVFQSLFRIGNEDITKALIRDIINQEIESIDLDNDKNLTKKYTEQKLGILDLIATLDNGVKCNIEIQLIDYHNTQKRFLYYWSKTYANQMLVGDKYADLKKVISICILDYELPELNEIEKMSTTWKIKEEIEKIILTDDLEIHIIEIPKVKRLLEAKTNKKDRIAQWITFLDNPNSKEVSEIMKENEDIKNAVGKLKEMSKNKELRRLAELREKAILDENNAKYGSRLEGIEIGRKEGEKAKTLEIAKKMIEQNIDKETIAKVTSLTVQEIEKIKM